MISRQQFRHVFFVLALTLGLAPASLVFAQDATVAEKSTSARRQKRDVLTLNQRNSSAAQQNRDLNSLADGVADSELSPESARRRFTGFTEEAVAQVQREGHEQTARDKAMAVAINDLEDFDGSPYANAAGQKSNMLIPGGFHGVFVKYHQQFATVVQRAQPENTIYFDEPDKIVTYTLEMLNDAATLWRHESGKEKALVTDQDFKAIARSGDDLFMLDASGDLYLVEGGNTTRTWRVIARGIATLDKVGEADAALWRRKSHLRATHKNGADFIYLRGTFRNEGRRAFRCDSKDQKNAETMNCRFLTVVPPITTPSTGR